ncbi:MAG: light-harvesting protein [Pseudomonadota bacterium]
MNNAKMWLVVKPTVGVPLFLSAVAIGSFAVHVAVLTNTSWVSDFLSGNELGTGDKAAAVMDATPPVSTVGLTQSAPMVIETLGDGRQAVLVLMPDGTTAKAILERPIDLASLTFE